MKVAMTAADAGVRRLLYSGVLTRIKPMASSTLACGTRQKAVAPASARRPHDASLQWRSQTGNARPVDVTGALPLMKRLSLLALGRWRPSLCSPSKCWRRHDYLPRFAVKSRPGRCQPVSASPRQRGSFGTDGSQVIVE